MDRITTKHLETQLRELAAVTNAPMQPPWNKRLDGTNIATVGALVIDGNIGGYRIEQICNEAGAVTTPLGDYRYSKRELFQIIVSAVRAVRLALGEDEFHVRMRRAYPDVKAA